MIATIPDIILSGGIGRSSVLLDFIVGDAMPRQDLKRVCWCLFKLEKIELWPVLTPTLFFWKMERIHLPSPSYSESGKLVCVCRNVRAEEFQCAACWKALLAHGQQRGTGLAKRAGGREMKSIFYNTLGSIGRMLCLAWTGLTWCLGFFSHNAGKIDIREIQR